MKIIHIPLAMFFGWGEEHGFWQMARKDTKFKVTDKLWDAVMVVPLTATIMLTGIAIYKWGLFFGWWR